MNWQGQIEKLEIPYPQKARLAREISEHLVHCPNEAAGTFDTDGLQALREIHNTRLYLMLECLPLQIRRAFETLFAIAPVIISVVAIYKEGSMFQFIHEGGAAMYSILAVGFLLLVRELLLLVRVFIIKDHSPENLKIESFTVVIGALGLFFLGLTGFGLGAYLSADSFVKAELPTAILIMGLKESLTCLTLSTSLSTLVLLLHFFTRRMLAHWQVPKQLLD